MNYQQSFFVDITYFFVFFNSMAKKREGEFNKILERLRPGSSDLVRAMDTEHGEFKVYRLPLSEDEKPEDKKGHPFDFFIVYLNDEELELKSKNFLVIKGIQFLHQIFAQLILKKGSPCSNADTRKQLENIGNYFDGPSSRSNINIGNIISGLRNSLKPHGLDKIIKNKQRRGYYIHLSDPAKTDHICVQTSQERIEMFCQNGHDYVYISSEGKPKRFLELMAEIGQNLSVICLALRPPC